MSVKRKSIPQPPPHGVVVSQATQALEGLQPPILEQTGSLIKGAETDKLMQQNRRRRHALQEQQAPTTLWSTHRKQWLEGLTNRPGLLKHLRISQRKAPKK